MSICFKNFANSSSKYCCSLLYYICLAWIANDSWYMKVRKVKWIKEHCSASKCRRWGERVFLNSCKWAYEILKAMLETHNLLEDFRNLGDKCSKSICNISHAHFNRCRHFTFKMIHPVKQFWRKKNIKAKKELMTASKQLQVLLTHPVFVCHSSIFLIYCCLYSVYFPPVVFFPLFTLSHTQNFFSFSLLVSWPLVCIWYCTLLLMVGCNVDYGRVATNNSTHHIDRYSDYYHVQHRKALNPNKS